MQLYKARLRFLARCHFCYVAFFFPPSRFFLSYTYLMDLYGPLRHLSALMTMFFFQAYDDTFWFNRDVL